MDVKIVYCWEISLSTKISPTSNILSQELFSWAVAVQTEKCCPNIKISIVTTAITIFFPLLFIHHLNILHTVNSLYLEKKKMEHSGSVALRHWNSIHKNGPQSSIFWQVLSNIKMCGKWGWNTIENIPWVLRGSQDQMTVVR